MNQRDNVGYFPVAYASFLNCLAAVQLLVDADCAFFVEGVSLHEQRPWDDVLWDARLFSSDEVVKCFVQALADRRRRLAAIACQNLPCAKQKKLDLWPDKVLDATAASVQNLLQQNHVSIPPALEIKPEWRTIYHLLFMRDRSTKWADIFFNAGFRDFVEDLDFENNPLLADFGFRCRIFSDLSNIIRYSAIITWLLSKGLRLDDTKLRDVDDDEDTPRTLLPIHFVGKRITYLLQDPWDLGVILDIDTKSLLSQILISQTSDDCKCMCSTNGCCAITVMLKSTAMVKWKPDIATVSIYKGSKWEEIKGKSSEKGFSPDKLYCFIMKLDDVLGYVPLSERRENEHCRDIRAYCAGLTSTYEPPAVFAYSGWDFLPAQIIRFLTFTRLQLTHTCCILESLTSNVVTKFADENRIEIQEEESVGLNELEKLMSEFERAYVSLGSSLPKFLSGYWNRRMDEFMSNGEEEEMDHEEARRQIRELGVVLES